VPALIWPAPSSGSRRQPDPLTAALDTWVLCFQMADYFETGPGHEALGEASTRAVEACRRMEEDFAQLAASMQRAMADARSVLDEATDAFRPDRPITLDAGAWSDRATRAVQGIEQLGKAASTRATELLEARVAEGARERLSTQAVSLFFVVLALMGLALVGRNLVRSIRERQEHAKLVTDEYKGNQAAILRLMDEMSVIADGDLTARARVGDDMTGAIADAVNVTVAELRKVVERINDTAGQVSRATQSAQEIATRLTEPALSSPRAFIAASACSTE